jgi:hypothetical protein
MILGRHARSEPSFVDSRISHYRIVEKLGGGMGGVGRAIEAIDKMMAGHAGTPPNECVRGWITTRGIGPVHFKMLPPLSLARLNGTGG